MSKCCHKSIVSVHLIRLLTGFTFILYFWGNKIQECEETWQTTKGKCFQNKIRNHTITAWPLSITYLIELILPRTATIFNNDNYFLAALRNPRCPADVQSAPPAVELTHIQSNRTLNSFQIETPFYKNVARPQTPGRFFFPPWDPWD